MDPLFKPAGHIRKIFIKVEDMKKLSIVTMLLFIGSFLFGGDITITGSYGETVTLHKPAERIVSIAPSITETVFALGKGKLLVGRTDYGDYPAEAASVQSIGSLTDPNIEKIVELKPDIVIASNHFKKGSADKLRKLSIKVLILKEDKTFDGVYTTIRDVAKITGAEQQGELIIKKMKTTVQAVESAVKGKPRPRVYYVIGFGEYGEYTAGGNTFIGQMITMAGGNNIASGLNGWAYSLEKIVAGNPDIIICSKYWDTKKKLMKANGYKDLRAVKEGKVFAIDNNLLDRQGPRLAEGLRKLAEIIHPESFQ